MSEANLFPGLGSISMDDGWVEIENSRDFSVGRDGVMRIISTGDGKIDLIAFKNHALAYVKSDMGYPAYYPLRNIERTEPVKAILMDLDGTTVHSEQFWIWIIEKTVQSLLHDPSFSFATEDIPFVSGHSVSEHLQYCIKKYAPKAQLITARDWYSEHTRTEMEKILKGEGKPGAFRPAPGIKAFLLGLKALDVKIALVTSGLYHKAYPEILSAFETLDLGDPAQFYDCIITAGDPLGKGKAGTLGELEAKPHPWLYAEACRVGLDVAFEERGHVIGIEDSGAGICALRLAGYYTVGIAGGNILQSGTRGMCQRYMNNFDEILRGIREQTI